MKKLEMEYGPLICTTTFSTQHQPSFVFLQSKAGPNNKRDNTKSCKHQSHEGV